MKEGIVNMRAETISPAAVIGGNYPVMSGNCPVMSDNCPVIGGNC